MAESIIQNNLAEVHARIAAACLSAGRDPSEVGLICVSKTKPAEAVLEAYHAGEKLFGENKVQEIREKAPVLPEDIQWHMIGHLQTNKVKQVIGHAAMIHSIDSVRLAETVSKEAVKAGIVMPVLIEVNMAAEESKFGIRPEDAMDFVGAILPLPGIKIEGLMTIAPYTETPEENRVYFRGLRKLSVDINGKYSDNLFMHVLSMGMTGDFEVAIEEGATFVRVGTGIFGERNYHIE